VAAWRAGLHRAIDVTLAGLALIATSPLMLAASALIRLDSDGPVLFRQTRIGRNGRPFELIKLRTMASDADPAPHQDHVMALIAGGARSEPWAPIADDPRVTRVGRWLRRTCLDELPQLVNVLRGEMSLVGPRPATPYECALWSDRDRRRLAVRPGMTGLWQVEGRGLASFDTMVDLDLAYIERRSPALDVAILLRTPLALLATRRSG
jgi:lipopolysaccharide/colanic/teichoic acid biosynthesis glycosyltransferase